MRAAIPCRREAGEKQRPASFAALPAMSSTTNGSPGVFDGLWLACFLLASTIWCYTAAAALGATFDEPTYIRCGLEHWRTGSYKQLMRLGAMPLAVDIQTLPVHLLERWQGAPIPFEQALRWSRAGTLVSWWILLIYGLRAGRSVAGNWGGRLAVALLACEPVLLGHAALATSDIPVAACLLALAVEFHLGRARRWPRRVVVPAIFYGLAVLAKASALIFGPLCLVVMEVQRLWHATALEAEPARSRERISRSFVDISLIVLGGLAVTFLYCGSDWSTEPTFIQWAHTLPAGRINNLIVWTSEHLRIFPNAGEGLVQQIKHNIRGQGAFILDREYRRAVWFYFPVALTMKLSLSLLAGVLVIAAVRRGAFRNWACFITLVLLVYSVTCRVQIGIRLMLPLVAFFCVGLGAAAATGFNRLSGWRRTVITMWLVTGLSSNAFAAVHVWPNGICFINAAWGGTPNGYRLLSDSNYDWGQGLPDLRKWLQERNEPELNIWYFGSDPSVHEAPFHELPLHALTNDEKLSDAVSDKLVAVSITLLYGTYVARSPTGSEAAAYFRNLRPTDRTMTFLIYDLRRSARLR
jgi:hypothetical protein